MALSDTTVRQAKTTGKAYTIGDTDGGRIPPPATRAGISATFVQKRLSLGTYPEIPLKEALNRRDNVRELVARGINPKRHRNQETSKPRAATGPSGGGSHLPEGVRALVRVP